MQIGKGIKEAHVEKLLDKIKLDLLETEAVEFVCKCSNFKPMVDRIVVTNQRLLALSNSDGQVKYEAHYGEVLDVVAESSWMGASLTISAAGGAGTTFKSMELLDAKNVRNLLISSPFSGRSIPSSTAEHTPTGDTPFGIVAAEPAAQMKQVSAQAGPKPLQQGDAGPPSTSRSLPQPTLGEQLLQLAELHRQGVLSDEEFGRAKASLFGSS